jgi:hypothetical protein
VSPRYHRAAKRRLASLRLKPLSHREYRGRPHTFSLSPAVTANPSRTGDTEAVRIPSPCRPRSPREPLARGGHRGQLSVNHDHQARSRGRHQGVHRGRRRCVPALPPRHQTTSGVPSTETLLARGTPRPSAYLLPVARDHRANPSRAGDTEASSASTTTTKPSPEGDTKASAPDAAGVSPRYHRATNPHLCVLHPKTETRDWVRKSGTLVGRRGKTDGWAESALRENSP